MQGLLGSHQLQAIDAKLIVATVRIMQIVRLTELNDSGRLRVESNGGEVGDREGMKENVQQVG